MTGNETLDPYEYDCTVFLVDDDEDDRKFFAEALKEADAKVQLILFSSGKELLAHLHSDEPLPDIIFLDLYMPEMSGETCLSHIRTEEQFDSISLVIYSTVMNLSRVEALFNSGVQRYLRKPSSFRVLKNALKKAIESVRKNPLGGQAIINYSE
ncbi:response regulator [Pricia sp. S334]|uniref:Response regulator n=1 Tax=Pricia mediterranea TaxID=3076079 RepID=A0ABU3L2G8_9FLAO|nr:response regulator [Pricia sp. S334]MDT7827593.1 response regulator [Pricia sp. S334]